MEKDKYCMISLIHGIKKSQAHEKKKKKQGAQGIEWWLPGSQMQGQQGNVDQVYKILVMSTLGDLTYSMVIIVNDIVLYT